MRDLLKNQCIFLGTVPKFDELICTILSIDLNEGKDKSIKSDFHWQILKCRILIFSTTNIIVSPVLSSLTHIYVVMHMNLHNTNYFKHLLFSNNLKILKECQVTSYIFEACLKYTLLARLSGKWNSVDNLLIEGRDFLITQGPLNGVKYNITANESEIIISVCAIKVRLNTVSNDYLLDNKNMEVAERRDLYNEMHWIKVLPSMKRGRIVSVSKTFPKQSCFKDYTELRRHWKNIYGYRLPEDDKEIIYLGIHFFGATIFTYPIHCVRTSLSIMPMNHNYCETIYRFISDLNGIFPTICNVPFHLKNEFRYSTLELLKIKNLSDTDRPPNWIQDTTSSHTYQDNNEFNNNKKLFNTELLSTQESQSFSSQNDYNTQNISLCTPSQIANVSAINEKSTQKIPIIPVFTRKSTCHNFTKANISTNTPQNSLENRNISKSERFMQNLIKPVKPTFIKPKKVNMFEVLKNKLLNNKNSQFNVQNSAAIYLNKEINPFKNNYKKENMLEEALKEESNSFSSSGNVETKIKPIFQNKVKNSKVNYLIPNFKKNTEGKEYNLSMESKKNSTMFSNDGKFNKLITPNFPNKIKTIATVSFPSIKKRTKRKEEISFENKLKKPRVKQPNSCDIRQMAINGNLAKANIPSLTEYLKVNNIPYKTKDKKGDLINKVLNHIDLTIIK